MSWFDHCRCRRSREYAVYTKVQTLNHYHSATKKPALRHGHWLDIRSILIDSFDKSLFSKAGLATKATMLVLW